MNVEIGTEAPIFLFWEYLFQIFGILSLQCELYSDEDKDIDKSATPVKEVARISCIKKTEKKIMN